MFHSLNLTHNPKPTPLGMETPIPSLPETPIIPPRNTNYTSPTIETMVSTLTLPGNGSESEYSSPGQIPFIPTTAAEILAQPAPSPVPSSTTTVTNTTSSHPITTPSPPPAIISSPAFDPSQKKQHEAEEADKKAWIARYTEAQPCRMLLKTTDPEYAEIMRVWRLEQKMLEMERKKEVAASVVEIGDGGKKEKKEKAKWWHF